MGHFKVSYGLFRTVIIQAESFKEAATKYFNLYPCKEDKRIKVVEKGFRNRKNVVWYKTSELSPYQKTIKSGNMDFNEHKLDAFSLKLLHFIKKNNLEWLNSISNCDLEFDEESGFIIRIYNPFQNFYPLEISTCDSESDFISFGFSWIDWYDLRQYANVSFSEWKNNTELVYKTVIKFVNFILKEELISADANYTKGLGTVNGLFLTEEEYNLTIEQNTLIQAISWKGTYNFPKNI